MENRRSKSGSIPSKKTKKKNRFEGTSRVIGDFNPNFVAMATRVGPTFSMVPLNRPSPKTPYMCKHLRSICRTSRVIGDFVPKFWSQFWGWGGLNEKSKNNVLWSATWRTDGQKMARFRRETKREESIWRSVTYIQTDRVNDKKNSTLRLGAESIIETESQLNKWVSLWSAELSG